MLFCDTLESWFPKSSYKFLRLEGKALDRFCNEYILMATQWYTTSVFACCAVIFGLGNYLVSLANRCSGAGARPKSPRNKRLDARSSKKSLINENPKPTPTQDERSSKGSLGVVSDSLKSESKQISSGERSRVVEDENPKPMPILNVLSSEKSLGVVKDILKPKPTRNERSSEESVEVGSVSLDREPVPKRNERSSAERSRAVDEVSFRDFLDKTVSVKRTPKDR